MSEEAIFSIFPQINVPILTVSDVTSGLTRAVAEKAMGSSTQRAVTEQLAQTVGSGIGRALDMYDDKIPMAGGYVEGSMPIMKAAWTGLATGTADWAMGRNPGWKRWAVPVATDLASSYATSWATTGGVDRRVI